MRIGPRWLAVGIGAAALVPRLATAGHFQTTDETLWIARTVGFSDGLTSLSPSQMTASRDALATMPGITTMWVGTVGRVLWGAADALGLRSGHDALASSRSGMAFTHVVMAVVTSALIALFVLVAGRWCGRVAATLAGIILATEPFVVAHGSLLHTDELTMLFGINGSLLLLLVLEGRVRGRASEIGAGVLLAGAALTKISALALGPGLAVMAAIHLLLRRGRPGEVRAAIASVARVSGAAVVTFVVAWPALWVDPIDQLRLLWRSATLSGEGYRTFFRGEVTSSALPAYYLFVLPLRMSPWFLASVALIPLGVRRLVRGRLVALVVLAAPAFVVMSTSAKVYDRYVLLVVPHLALAVGLGGAALARVVQERVPIGRPARVAAVASALAVTAHAVAVAPYGLTYFNPVAGGSGRAERTLLIGWGEGMEQAGDLIAARQQGDCDIAIDVLGPGIELNYPCIREVTNRDPAYRVIYISERQRLDAEGRPVPRDGVLVGVVRIRGLDMAEVYDLRPGATVESPPP